MAKQPRSLTGKVVVNHRRRARHRARDRRGADARGRARRDRRPGRRAAERTAAELGGGGVGLRSTSPTTPAHRVPRRGRGTPRAARRAGQQRRDHVGDAPDRGERAERRPPARAQPAGGDPRDAGGDEAHGATRHGPHRQRRFARRPRRHSEPGDVLRDASTAWSASPRRCALELRGTGVERVGRHAVLRPHRAGHRRGRLARRAARLAGGGGGGGRRRRCGTSGSTSSSRARRARLVWLGAVLPRRAREAVAHALKLDQVALHADRSARAGYEARAAASAPAADEDRTTV